MVVLKPPIPSGNSTPTPDKPLLPGSARWGTESSYARALVSTVSRPQAMVAAVPDGGERVLSGPTAASSVVATARWEGKPLADLLYEQTRARVEEIRGRGGRPPRLASVAVGDGGPFNVYQRQQGKMAARAGIEFESSVLTEGISQDDLETKVQGLGSDPSISGVILQHPLPGKLDFLRAVARLPAAKDVDGVGSENLGRLAAHRPVQVPAVAQAARELLLHHQVRPEGRRVVVVGRSETVGIPTALLFLLRGEGGDATVTVAHSRSKDLAEIVRTGEIVVSCVGRPGLLDRTNVSRGAFVVDVGLSTAPDPSRPSGVRMEGDADARSLEGWAAGLTPVPGGVGPVTVAVLMRNCLRAHELLATNGSRAGSVRAPAIRRADAEGA